MGGEQVEPVTCAVIVPLKPPVVMVMVGLALMLPLQLLPWTPVVTSAASVSPVSVAGPLAVPMLKSQALFARATVHVSLKSVQAVLPHDPPVARAVTLYVSAISAPVDVTVDAPQLISIKHSTARFIVGSSPL